MSEPEEVKRWIFRCQKCGHEVKARSFLYLSRCPLCNSQLAIVGRDLPWSGEKEVKEDEARAEED